MSYGVDLRDDLAKFPDYNVKAPFLPTKDTRIEKIDERMILIGIKIKC